MMEDEKFTFFWGGPFSNWAKSPFQVDALRFNCGEQYMMYHKAIHFKDYAVAGLVMKTSDPKLQKKLGRTVRAFDPDEWQKVCVTLMVGGLYAKFTQNAEMKETLLKTVGTTIVEASPDDVVWGIGLAADDPKALDRSQWRGQNLLGIVLMKVRDQIMKEEELDAGSSQM